MSDGRWDGGRVQPSRTRRHGQERRRRELEVVLAVVLVAAGIAFAAVQLSGGGDGVASPTPSGPPASAGERPSTLLALSVTGSPNALLATVGSGAGRAPAAFTLATGMTVIVPGQGEAATQDVQALPGDSMRIAVSNAVGAWALHYAVTDLDHLGAAIDREGGLTVNLGQAYTISADVLGPGETDMTGAQILAFLSEQASDSDLRWAGVLEAMLANGPVLQAVDLTETDDPAATSALLQAAGGASVEVGPVQVVGGTAMIPLQPDFDAMVGELFGTVRPVRVDVRNGTGAPGVGEAAARRLIPAGFRVVLSGNAESFDHATTEVIATGDAHQADAERAQKALGVGTVEVSQVPSGVAEVTVVVGKDFKG